MECIEIEYNKADLQSVPTIKINTKRSKINKVFVGNWYIYERYDNGITKI